MFLLSKHQSTSSTFGFVIFPDMIYLIIPNQCSFIIIIMITSSSSIGAVLQASSRGRWGFDATRSSVLALAVAPCLHRRRHSERRWRLEGGFRQHRRVEVVEQWDLDHRYRAQDQAWGPGRHLEGWGRRQPRRTTCTDPRCPGLGTRWDITPSWLVTR